MGNNFRSRDGSHRLTISEYKKKRKKEIFLHIAFVIIFILIIIIAVVSLKNGLTKRHNKENESIEVEDSSAEVSSLDIVDTYTEEPEEIEEDTGFLDKSEDSALFFEGYEANVPSDVAYISSENVTSTYAVLVNLENGNVVASKEGTVKIYPASMTKILTLLVAAEHIESLEDTFTMTQEIGDFVYTNDCSAVGFSVGETVTVQDLLYGTILPSGGDAAMCLAEYVAGSQEAFVEMMNEKLAELGLADTAHFTNCIGIYNSEHYCTLLDMAMILKAAEENELCSEVLKSRTYTTSATQEHPEGITVSNWFIRRIEDKDTHGVVKGAKTGFVAQSGCCGASYQVSNDGTPYICVTADAWSSWRCIYDQVEIYSLYTN